MTDCSGMAFRSSLRPSVNAGYDREVVTGDSVYDSPIASFFRDLRNNQLSIFGNMIFLVPAKIFAETLPIAFS
jgi:hypothetical protein